MGWLAREWAREAGLAPVAYPVPSVEDPEAVLATLADQLLPPEVDDEPPSWLLPHQHRSFRRGLAAVRTFGGALLADPVGTGKTFVALAVAERLASGAPIQVAAPAILCDWWQETAGRLGVSLTVFSHELASRGKVPSGCGPIIIDESHRFRHPDTCRYRTLAPMLVGRQGLLVTATPIHNRLEDVAHQLLLLIRDDALTLHGVASIRSALESGWVPPAAFTQIVVREHRQSGFRPARRSTHIPGTALSSTLLDEVVAAIDRLTFSPDRSVAMLLRTVFLSGAGSSPAALASRVARYRRLLAHGRDARRAGHRLSRQHLRAVIRNQEDQLVFWSLLEPEKTRVDLTLSDLDRLDGLSRAIERWRCQGDRKLTVLQAALQDPRPTLVFCTALETVHYLRRQLSPEPIAWCTGDGAGIGPMRAARSQVLAHFRPEGDRPVGAREPRILLATDVAAEGLNLQRIGRVVHYDLPWTAVRLEQRDGRALRRGAVHREVEIVEFGVPPAIEERLTLMTTIHRKAALPARLGLSDRSVEAWSWVEAVAELAGPRAERGTVAAVLGERIGILAAFALHCSTGYAASMAVWISPAGDWTSDGRTVRDAFAAIRGAASRPLEREEQERLHQILMNVERELERQAQGVHYWNLEPHPAVTRLTEALLVRANAASRMRRHEELAAIDRVVQWLSRGHTAGEIQLIGDVDPANDDGWRALLPLVTRQPELETVTGQLIGAVAVVPEMGRGSIGWP